MISKVLCFGELLLRVSPAPQDSNAEKHPFLLYMGGAEANAATALAGWNVPVKYCTVLPDNFMSHHLIDYLEYKGIFTSSILFAGNRIGVYYLERGADLKGSMVYDRAHSSFSELKPGMIDWDKVLRDVSWFNFTAISPAINQNVADVCLEALEAASRKGITISVDLNYRSRLWKYGKSPIEIMPQLVKHCDVIMGNIWSANTLLGTKIDEHIHDRRSKQAYLSHAETTSAEIMKMFPKCKTVANTFRFDSEGDNLKYYTALHTGGNFYHSHEFSCAGVVDRSGSGDCFMAGLIYGLYNNHEAQELLNYATAAAFGKLQEQGDATGQDVLTVKNVKAVD
ncbi:2-dehydro-3-deoxygluconokinase [Mucilaginibacter gracilis]|uniref:2-dehydro-3-deoxygluconokinase n=1 Tax=Mucilaginibacter gracilis TaxID=423350 RepID=A0A495IW00_9SPHI|nr:sugar kinase [Mucilaginibacter gracilis]RKR80926.1 2-dehydro-3-deoxygluconokinase [Mucilaginibacter gracilis]